MPANILEAEVYRKASQVGEMKTQSFFMQGPQRDTGSI